MGQPIGVAHYLHTQQRPEGMAQALPQEFERLLDEAGAEESGEVEPDATEEEAGTAEA